MEDKKLKVIYDIKSIPNECMLDNLHNIMVNAGIVVWDSSNGGKEPIIIESKELTVKDVALIPKEDFDALYGNLMH